jgi:hypothetical protein
LTTSEVRTWDILLVRHCHLPPVELGLKGSCL